LTPDNVSPRGKKAAELDKMLEAGALAFKAFMTFTWEIPRLDDGLLLTAFERLAKSGVPVGVHSENAEIVRYMEDHYKSLGREDPIVHAEARPELAEVEAVGKVLELARGTGAQAHLVHLSVPEAVDLVAEARSRWGLNATAETCHHYLTLTSEALTELGPYAKCNPPLRSRRCVEGMWERLRLGCLDNIGSDHGPFTREEKEKESFWDVPAGLTGIQVMVPLVITEARRRGVPLETVVRLCSSNPARIFHIYPQKGAIAPGSDGDLVLVDVRGEWPVTARELYSKEKWTPHEGWTLTARVKRTLVRGRTVYKDTPDGGRIVAEAGSGRFVRPVRQSRSGKG
ncbi:MAG: amidohydrolase family protein, partial [Firmicutes bacterium]|nr:amidohydrolase family protein [Bacillota bacterium]